MIKFLTIALVLTATTLGLATTTHANQAQPEPSSNTVATFEGATFNMADGWGAATACHVTDSATTCYRSEAAMDRALNENAPSSRAANCSSSLRLYDGTNKTGAVISLSTRQSVISLSAYGFDNRTSSYRVGACSASLYNGLGTSKYSGNTSAGASANSMASGWNNVISSVAIA
jgi:hypothetical protein